MRVSSRSESSRNSSALAKLTVMVILALITAAAPAAAQVKVAVIDVQRILLESKRGLEVQQDLDKVRNEKRESLAAQAQELEALRKEFSEKALTLAEERLAELQTQIEDKTIALRRAQDDATQEFQQLSESRLQEIENEVMPIIDAVGKEGGYTLVFNKFQSGLVFADEAIDITQQVIARYDGGN